MQKYTNAQLREIATRGRLMALKMVYKAASGHIGGSLSCMDILTELYFNIMDIDPAFPSMEERDRLVMSKGRCSPALYSILALRGFFPKEKLDEFRQLQGHLSGHVEMRHVPGVDMSTGSLGQGLSAAVGMALAGKVKKQNYRVYSILGDGELEEGQIWEALMSAAKYGLDNLCVIVDVNGLQIDGPTANVMPMEPLADKFSSFGCSVIEIDGHDFDALEKAFIEARDVSGRPTAIIARTVKGKGVSFMENKVGWHGKAPKEEEYLQAKAELTAVLMGTEV